MRDTVPPTLSLTAMLEAAFGLLEAGGLPAPPGISTRRLVDAGGMHPWLRIAFGREGADFLRAEGKSNWWLGALMGRENIVPDRPPSIMFSQGEADALLAVDTLCADALLGRASVWHSLKSRIGLAAARRLLPSWEVDGEGEEPTPSYDALASAFHEIAAAHSLSPRRVPVDLGLWAERRVEGILSREGPRDPLWFLDGMRSRSSECALVELVGGGTIWLNKGCRLTWPGEISPGTRLLLTWKGAVDGHEGYLASVQDLDVQAELASIRRWLDHRQDVTTPLGGRIQEPRDREGRRLGEGDHVELEDGCREAIRGETGRVTEVLGQMVMVNFGRRGARRVPCLGRSLKLLAEQAPVTRG